VVGELFDKPILCSSSACPTGPSSGLIGHLLPHGEGKIPDKKAKTLKTLAQLGEGGPRQWWVRALRKANLLLIFSLSYYPSSGLIGHLLPEGEEKTILQAVVFAV